MSRLPNYKINAEISSFRDFENYNRSIVGYGSEQTYTVIHWDTPVLKYDQLQNKIVYLYGTHYSQTTSALVGRIVRSLPRSAVMSYIESLDSKQAQRRLARMLGI